MEQLPQEVSRTNKDLISQLYKQVFVDWDLAGVNRIFAPQFIDHDLPPGIPPGIEGFYQFYAMLRTAFPDLRYTVKEMISEGDKVVVQWSWQATHQGQFFGFPPTGRDASTNGIAIYRIQDGQVVERWVKMDLYGLLRKLGASILPAQA